MKLTAKTLNPTLLTQRDAATIPSLLAKVRSAPVIPKGLLTPHHVQLDLRRLGYDAQELLVAPLSSDESVQALNYSQLVPILMAMTIDHPQIGLSVASVTSAGVRLRVTIPALTLKKEA